MTKLEKCTKEFMRYILNEKLEPEASKLYAQYLDLNKTTTSFEDKDKALQAAIAAIRSYKTKKAYEEFLFEAKRSSFNQIMQQTLLRYS